MAKLGFLGLGTMGYPMARNLLRAGHSDKDLAAVILPMEAIAGVKVGRN